MNYMEKISIQNTFEQRKDELKGLIAVKETAAVYEEQYDDLFQTVEQYEDILRSGSRLSDYEQKDYLAKKAKIESFSIKVSTLPELRFILEQLGQAEDEIRMNLAHENAHANVAQSHGAHHEGYIVYFLKNGNVYQTRITFPDHFTQEQVDEISEKAIQAPETYGVEGGLSDDDENQLKEFRENNRQDDQGLENRPKGWDYIN